MKEKDLELRLQPFINELAICSQNKLYHTALSLALTLPDICSSIEFPHIKGRKKYIAWLDKYFMTLHIEYDGFMTSQDVYALRCAYLHNGSNDLDSQQSKDVVNRFYFIYSVYGNKIHRLMSVYEKDNEDYSVLGLSIEAFSDEMIQSVNNFIKKNKNNKSINKNSASLMNFKNDANGIII